VAGADTYINVSIDPLILTELAATISAETNLQSGYDTLLISENSATISLLSAVSGRSWMKRHSRMIIDYEHLQ